MEGDNKNQGIVWCVSVMVITTYLLSDSTIVKDIENTRKCGFFNLHTLSSALDIQMLVIPSLWNLSGCSFAVHGATANKQSIGFGVCYICVTTRDF